MTKEERLKAAEEYSADQIFINANNPDNNDHLFNEYIAREAFIKGAECEAEGKWISVQDGYPRENEEVIVYFEYKFEGRETETGVTSAIYETQNTLRHCFYQHNGSVVVGVVKWQPMPTP